MQQRRGWEKQSICQLRAALGIGEREQRRIGQARRWCTKEQDQLLFETPGSPAQRRQRRLLLPHPLANPRASQFFALAPITHVRHHYQQPTSRLAKTSKLSSLFLTAITGRVRLLLTLSSFLTRCHDLSPSSSPWPLLNLDDPLKRLLIAILMLTPTPLFRATPKQNTVSKRSALCHVALYTSPY